MGGERRDVSADSEPAAAYDAHQSELTAASDRAQHAIQARRAMNNETSIDFRFAVNSTVDAHRARMVSDLMESSPNPMRLDRTQGDSPYSGHLQVRTFGGIGLMQCQLDSPAGSNILFVSERSRPHIARNQSSEFIISIWLGGENQLNTFGRVYAGQAGDFTVTSTDNPFCVHVSNRGHACNLSLPAAWDRIGDSRLENTFGTLFSGGCRPHQGLTSYVRHLLACPNALAMPDAAGKLYDVIALALNPRAKGDHQSGLLALIRNHIDVHFADHDLRPAKVAAAFDVSVSYLHRLFATADMTFTEYVVLQRLEQAQRMLADPQHKSQKIISIAYGCGFHNINHFGLRFRARYGVTPGEFRQQSVGHKLFT